MTRVAAYHRVVGVDVFPHFYLEERVGEKWVPVALAAKGLARRVKPLNLPYEELGDVGMTQLSLFAAARFGLVKRAQRSRGLPKDVSSELRELYDAAHEDAVASLEEMAEEYVDDLSLGEGWITPDELAKVKWDQTPKDEQETYRALFGATFSKQLDRIRTLSTERSLRIVFWFTC
jgi:hypothetical protein